MADNKLFRKSALDTVSNPEQLDQHIRVTKPLAWVILSAIIVFTIGVGIWAFTGNIATGTDIQGVMFASNGVITANASHAGTIEDIFVEEGEHVEKGDMLLSIPDESLLAEIQELRKQPQNATVQEMIDTLRVQYQLNSFIRATKAGTVSNVPLVGDQVAEDQSVIVNFSEDAETSSREIISYVPYTIAGKFKNGTEVQISPSNAPREEYGFMLGKITSIGSTIVTAESVTKTMGTTKYLGSLDISANCVEVRIRPNVDSSTTSGFEWSNSKGGKEVLAEIGTICNIKVMSDPIYPINLII